jgi:hypothetical protein
MAHTLRASFARASWRFSIDSADQASNVGNSATALFIAVFFPNEILPDMSLVRRNLEFLYSACFFENGKLPSEQLIVSSAKTRFPSHPTNSSASSVYQIP